MFCKENYCSLFYVDMRILIGKALEYFKMV